jgi:FtsP/CotA-like multicopper oxidase with cupredoxin domain
MITAKVLVFIALTAAIISTVFAVASQSLVSFFASAQNAESKKHLIGGHTAGYGLYETSGDVLDPVNNYNNVSGEAVIDPDKYLRSFDYGRVSKLPDGTTLREYTLVADDRQTMEISPGVFYNVWTFNGTVPGPTLRATEGDLMRINFINNGTRPHSIHTHGIHKADMDGVFETINPHGKYVYEFRAEAFGVYPYHCHVSPIEEHISHGLYGVYIVDPKTPRPPADEMVMIMNGFDTDFDAENNYYAVNTIPYYYMHHPIEIEQDKPVRIYLVNMLEFDQINNFHLHGGLYHLYRSGTNMTSDEYTDLVTMSQGERAILEFSLKYPGQYMFHAHKTEFAEKGWMGLFLVKAPVQTRSDIGNNSSNSGDDGSYPQTTTISARDIGS